MMQYQCSKQIKNTVFIASAWSHSAESLLGFEVTHLNGKGGVSVAVARTRFYVGFCKERPHVGGTVSQQRMAAQS
jgi:hypothetical protein